MDETNSQPLAVDSPEAMFVATVFNDLTGATRAQHYKRMLVAPYTMRTHFIELIRREAEHARQGRLSGIDAKMNQLHVKKCELIAGVQPLGCDRATESPKELDEQNGVVEINSQHVSER